MLHAHPNYCNKHKKHQHFRASAINSNMLTGSLQIGAINADTADEAIDQLLDQINVENAMEDDHNDVDAEEEEEDESHFDKISKMYIKNETRDGYNSSNRLLLLWLGEKHKHCVSEQAKTALEHTFKEQIAASDKYNNKLVSRKALELVTNANSVENSPIILSHVTTRYFVDFLHYRASIRGNTFLSKSGCGGFRSAFRELHRQCGTTISPALEDDLKEKFKGLLRGHAGEKAEKEAV